MGDGMRKVRTGDPLNIPAATFNTFIDSARDFLQRQNALKRNRAKDTRNSGIILVKNASGSDRERFHILGITEPVISPTDNEDQFKNRVALKGETPNEDDHLGKFVILLEPLKAGSLGLAMAMGVCPVRINIEKEEYACADVNDGNAASLKSGTSGSAQILWKESGTGVKWAIVRIGVNTSGTSVNPKILSGTGATADTETWDITDQPEGCDGVTVLWHRTYWSGTSGDPVYLFTRTGTFDSAGRLVAVSAEERLELFGTGACS